MVMDFNGLQCYYTNADSLPNKLGELKTRIQERDKKYDLIAITEIYPKNCRYLPGKAELQLEGFDLLMGESKMKSTRGTAMYINKDLNAEEVKFEDNFEESIWVNIKLNGKDKMLVGCLYKSPSSNTENLEELNKLIIEVSRMKEFSHLLITGDFNFPKIDWKTWTSRGENSGEQFLESIRESYLIQHVTGVTRVRDNSEPSILDLILTNEENMIDEIIYSSPLGSSDHCGLEFVFKCYYELKENKSERWNYFKGDYDNMKNELNQDWDNLLNGKSTSQQLEIFMNIINEAKNKYVPRTNSKAKSKAKKHKCIPLDDKTIKQIKKKHRCWQRYMEIKDSKKYQEYIKMRNQVKGLAQKD
jgi:hypothetical protein